MTKSQGTNRILLIAAGAIVIWMIFYLLIVGQRFLIPIVIAVFIWNMLNTLNDGIKRIPTIGPHLPHWLSRLCSLLVVAGLLFILVNIISNNVSEVMDA